MQYMTDGGVMDERYGYLGAGCIYAAWKSERIRN